MYFELLSIIAILGLLHASLTDLNRREVLDYISYGLLSTALSIRFLSSLITGQWSVILEGIVGLAITVIVGMVMYYTGQWGGGDTKLLWALGAVLGFDGSLLSPLIVYGILLLMVGSVYGILYSLVLVRQHWKSFKREWKKQAKSLPRFFIPLTVVILCLGFIGFTTLSSSYEIPLLLISCLLLTLFLLFYIRVVEKACMLEWVSPTVLVEGDWIAKEVIIGGEVIVGPKDLGIEKNQIQKLQKLSQKVLRKSGIPFVPAMFFAYCISLFIIL